MAHHAVELTLFLWHMPADITDITETGDAYSGHSSTALVLLTHVISTLNCGQPFLSGRDFRCGQTFPRLSIIHISSSFMWIAFDQVGRGHVYSRHFILLLSSRDMFQREHSALLHLCQYVFPHVKPPWQSPNHFHLLLRVSGMHCPIICRPSQLFLFLEELSNIIYSCLLILTVVQNLVWSNQLNVSHFVIQCQLLPSHSP